MRCKFLCLPGARRIWLWLSRQPAQGQKAPQASQVLRDRQGIREPSGPVGSAGGGRDAPPLARRVPAPNIPCKTWAPGGGKYRPVPRVRHPS
jgi:hypothetical protein